MRSTSTPNVDEGQLPRLASIAGIATASGWWQTSASSRSIASKKRWPMRECAWRSRRAWIGMRSTGWCYRGVNQRAVSDILPTSWAAPAMPQWRYDPAAAARLLDGAGFRPGPDGVRVRADGTALRLGVSIGSNRPASERAMLFVQQALKPLGIDVTIKMFPVSFLFAQDGPLYGGTYDLAWTTDTLGPDPEQSSVVERGLHPAARRQRFVLCGSLAHAGIRGSDPDVRSRAPQAALSDRTGADP